MTLRELADAADVALGFEDGPGDPRLAVIARRGSTRWTLQVAGKGGHSSQIFRDDVGAGAIFEAARVLQLFRERLSHEPLLTFNPGAIVGGTAVTFDREQSRGTAAGKGTSSRRRLSSRETCARSRPSSWRAPRRRCRPSLQKRCRTRRRRFSSTTAIRRWRPPTAIAACCRCTTRRAATSAPVRCPRAIRAVPARPISRSRRGGSRWPSTASA